MSSSLSPAVLFRRRNGWEASDLGVFLWRNNWVPMILFMGIPAAILFFIYLIAVKLETEWISQITAIFIWWLKPLVDRFGLQVISVRFFEPHSPLRSLFKNLGKNLRKGLFEDLLWRRFSPFRSARMPLLVLERIKGKTYKRRKQLLTRNGLGFGLPLIMICIGISMALNIGELIFIQNIASNFRESSGNYLEFFNENIFFLSVLFYINELLIETLYVCMGFSLYINSRVETEGWDIELLFKNCVEKKKKAFLQKPAITALMVVLFLFIGLSPAQTQENSQDNKPVYTPEILRPAQVSEKSKETLNHILESPEFGTEKSSWKIQFKQSDSSPKDNTRIKRLSFPALKEILGIILRFALGAALIAALGIGAFFAYRYRKSLFPGQDGKSSIDKEAFPDEPRMLLQKAEELHRKGKIREAWALCFRTFTAIFTKYWFLSVPAEATEYETLTLVRKNSTDSSINEFAAFVRHWISFAYGGREPAAGTFEQALASCRVLVETHEK